MTCSVTSSCDGIVCCVDLPRIEKSVPVVLQVEDCRNTLHLQIGKLKTKLKLNNFNHGKF